MEWSDLFGVPAQIDKTNDGGNRDLMIAGEHTLYLSGEQSHHVRLFPFPGGVSVKAQCQIVWNTYCLLTLHHQPIQLVELTDDGLSLRKMSVLYVYKCDGLNRSR